MNDLPDGSALRAEMERRVTAVHSIMDRHDLEVTLAVASGAPAQTGWLRWLTGAELWAGQAFILIDRDSLVPTVVLWSNYLAEWIKQTATNLKVESTLEERRTPMARVAEILGPRLGGKGRLGMLGMNRNLYLSEYALLRDSLPDLELVELSEEVNVVRQVKSSLEVEAMRDMGRLLADALELFEAIARPGRDALEVSGEVEGFLRGKGCYWGRAKYAFDQRPYTLPAPARRPLAIDDVMVFQFVYSSPLGYWYELGCLYSFLELPAASQRRLDAMQAAMAETAAASVPGSTYGTISQISDRVFREHGLKLVGKHTEDCHSIGTDISDGPPFYSDAWELKEDMVLALHPASLVEGDLAFFICDHVLVKPGGGVFLSPLRSYYRSLSTT